MVNGGWIEYRFISGSKKFRSTRIGIDSVLDPRSVCSLKFGVSHGRVNGASNVYRPFNMG